MIKDARIDLDELRRWTGRSHTSDDRIDPWHAAALHAALDLDGEPPGEGDALPAGWHWLYFRETLAARDLSADGHAALGTFLPPVPLPRRMWAGGRLLFHGPLPIGAVARRRSTIREVVRKQGSTGPLVFVTVGHEISVDARPVLIEEHDIVYRDQAKRGVEAAVRTGPVAVGASAAALWQRSLTPDPTLLFRYSALTFNGHRIHYDADYCRAVEGYPGVIVHGPLIATLLLDLICRNVSDARVGLFAFRARAPLFCGESLLLDGSLADESSGELVLNAYGPDQRWLMSATAQLVS